MSVFPDPTLYPAQVSAVGLAMTRGQIEQKTLQYVEAMILPYLAEIERQNSIAPGSLVKPGSYDVHHALHRRPGDTSPLIQVVSTGTDPGKIPQRDGDGEVRAWWLVAVGAMVSASTELAAQALSGYYAAAIRLLMGQDPSLGDWAYGVDWRGEFYDDQPISSERTLATCRLVFSVEVHDVMNVYGGFPYGLPDDPYVPVPPEPVVDKGNAIIDLEVENIS